MPECQNANVEKKDCSFAPSAEAGGARNDSTAVGTQERKKDMICKQKKREKRRQERIKRWNDMITRGCSDGRNAAKQGRMDSGGYKRPGSYKRT